MTYKVYILINPLSSIVFYVGITKQKLRRRLLDHCSNQKSDKNYKKKKVIKDIKNNDKMPLIKIVKEFDDFKIAAKYELNLISLYKGILGDKLTNIADDEYFYKEMTKEKRKRISDLAKGNKRRLGKKHTEETKKLIGNAHRGKKATPELKAKLRLRPKRKVSKEERLAISAKMKGHSFNKGWKMNEEQKRKLSIAKTGKKRDENCKKLISETRKRKLKSGELIQVGSRVYKKENVPKI